LPASGHVGPVAHRAAVQLGHPGLEFGAAADRALVVVAGPGEVQADGVGLLPGGGGGEPAAQFGLPFRGIALFAEHDVEAIAEGVPAAGPGVVSVLWWVFEARGRLALLAGLSAVLVLIPDLLHGNPGFAQVGYRFILDALPLLWLLLALAFRQGISRAAGAALIAGMAVNIWLCSVAWSQVFA
jgi:hypothetical protein